MTVNTPPFIMSISEAAQITTWQLDKTYLALNPTLKIPYLTSLINQNRNALITFEYAGKKYAYYIKYDRQPWFAAGSVTKAFKGYGRTVNTDIFKQLAKMRDEEKYKVYLIFATPTRLYSMDIDTFQQMSVDTIQAFNGEPVKVVQMSLLKRFSTDDIETLYQDKKQQDALK